MLFSKKSGSDNKLPSPSQPASPVPPALPAAGNNKAPSPPQPAASPVPPALPAAGPAKTNGAASLDPDHAKKQQVAAKQMAAAFGEIVTLLLRSPSEKHHSLADLEWMVIPAVARGQFALAEAQSKETGAVAPVGAVMWAFVSADVDKRLDDLATPPRLAPAEWRSGDIPWVILATGDTKVLHGLLQQLSKAVFKDKAPKMRVRDRDGTLTVRKLEA